MALETQTVLPALSAFLREPRLHPHNPQALCQKLRENEHIQSVNSLMIFFFLPAQFLSPGYNGNKMPSTDCDSEAAETE